MFDQQLKFLTLNNKIMTELCIERMEMVSGGWSFGCTMAVLGGIGVVASIIQFPLQDQ
jgi:hypothetical protein